uniref:Uncharacterized protein n=1 Tax=Magallana gigas TaxID=29159 RepID=K1R6S2_MAGGI
MSSEHGLENSSETSEPSDRLSSVADISSPPSSTGLKFPNCTSEWDSRFVDKLGIRQKEEDIFRIILSEWCLVFLSEKEQLEVENCVDVCDLQFDYESLENVPLQRLHESGWVPSSKQVEQIRNIPLLKKFLMKLDEYNFYLAQIIRGSKSNTAISEGKYETLFEKLLQIFGFYTLSQSFISIEKAFIQGRNVSSRADIICSLERPASERAVICVCEVRVTYLAVKESSWRRIQNTPANGAESVDYEEGEHPRFFYIDRPEYFPEANGRGQEIILSWSLHQGKKFGVNFNCCAVNPVTGVHNDFDETPWCTTEGKCHDVNAQIPKTCCVGEKEAQPSCDVYVTSGFKTTGCFDRIKELIQAYSVVVIGISLAIMIIEAGMTAHLRNSTGTNVNASRDNTQSIRTCSSLTPISRSS